MVINTNHSESIYIINYRPRAIVIPKRLLQKIALFLGVIIIPLIAYLLAGYFLVLMVVVSGWLRGVLNALGI